MGRLLTKILLGVTRRARLIIDAQESAPAALPEPTDLAENQVTWELVGGERLVNVHSESLCAGQWCVIHRPSDHHMVEWRQHWRADRGLMEQICPCHSIGHPDPDEINPDTVHGCDGCCALRPTPPYPPAHFDVV